MIPLYNEAPVVRAVVEEARKTFPKVVCVDDGSTDASVVEARAAGAVVVRHPVNLGQGASLRTGLDYALADPSADYFVTFDADGQHQVADAVAMVHMLDEQPLDIVVGSRFLDKRTKVAFVKRVVLKLGVVFERMSSGVQLTDAHNGLRAFNRHAAETVAITQNRMAHASEIVSEIGRNRLRWAEAPVHVVYTDYSRSKGQSVWNSVNILSDLFLK
ncbi:glycosyltransferase family 2 protein [Leifsonia poae]|uniref:Glycosyl transferase n=1 Tax=Leifsonia poae TaxID=110933 RepID=A0A9W6LZF2_9MICO|nr:glycosyltransferase family 2 protein [Leifsonia poae]GLJ75572.1 glycosyl transferase [Leifsonia poae]